MLQIDTVYITVLWKPHISKVPTCPEQRETVLFSVLTFWTRIGFKIGLFHKKKSNFQMMCRKKIKIWINCFKYNSQRSHLSPFVGTISISMRVWVMGAISVESAWYSTSYNDSIVAGVIRHWLYEFTFLEISISILSCQHDYSNQSFHALSAHGEDSLYVNIPGTVPPHSLCFQMFGHHLI